MSKASILVSSFRLKGKLAKIYRQKDQIKYIKLTAGNRNYRIKITKKLRAQIAGISCGSQLELKGKSKQKRKQGTVKYKAQVITLIPQEKRKNTDIKEETVSLIPIFDTLSQSKAKGKVLICQKSNCWKKGGRKVYEALESVLSDRNLTKQIPIKKTGCLKKCKRAPNLVMLPDKVHYTKVKPKQVESFVQKHLIAKT